MILLVWSLMLAGLSADDALIQEHLRQAESTLRARDVSHLSPELRAERARNLDHLRTYWQRGEFPRNTHHPGERVPYFIDDTGTTCAMAHLVVESGHELAARHIAARENHERIRDMRSPELLAWLASSGLTLDEAALIQPSYAPWVSCDCPCVFAPVNVRGGISYVNECVAVQCNKRRASDLELGCGEDRVDLFTGNTSNHPDADACRRRFRVEYEDVSQTYQEAFDAFQRDICEGPVEPGGEAPGGCQVVRAPGGAVPWVLLGLVGMCEWGRRRRREVS